MSPCPFCKSEKVSLKLDTPTAMPGSIVTFAYVECDECKARGPRFDDWDNKTFQEQAVAAWKGAL